MGQPRHRGTDGAVEPVLPHISANDGPRTGPVAATRRATGLRLLAMLLAAVLLVSCTPTEPVPSPTPSVQPTFQCTPESGEGDPTPCTSAEYEEMKERDALYAEAERVFRRAEELSLKLRKQRLPINDELTSLLTGEELEGTTAALTEGQTSPIEVSGDINIVWVRRAPNISDSGSIVALESCINPGSLQMSRNGEIQTPSTRLQQTFFVQADEDLRVVSTIYYERESC